MDLNNVIQLVGGLGMFLLGIHHITEGLKGLAGDSLRRALQKLVSGRLSAVFSGTVFTALVQSSTAAILTVIGFVSAGLITFPQSIGVIMGATLGTTTTPWMVAFLGFRMRIAVVALPILGIGALLWLVAKGRTRSLGAVLAGFGLIFIGIEYMQTGMSATSWNVHEFTGPGSMWILAGIGVLMTAILQSSSAAAAITLVALDAGSLTFHQGCAMIIGQSVGTTGTTALMMLGGGLAVRRAALAHILFSTVVGILGMVFLWPLASASEWIGARLDDYDGVLSLAAFSSLFKLAGIVVFFPFVGSFAHFIVRISGKGSETAVSQLDPMLADAGGGVALEAAWRANMEVARLAIDAVRRRLRGEAVTYQVPYDDVQQIQHFLESLSLETTNLRTVGPRLVRLVHALDHLEALHGDLKQIPSPVADQMLSDGFHVGADAVTIWLEATRAPAAAPRPEVFQQLESASRELREKRDSSRQRLLEDVAMRRLPATTARTALDSLAWSNRTLYHAWRLAESLRMAGCDMPPAEEDDSESLKLNQHRTST